MQSTKAFASTRVSAPPPADAAARAALERPRPRALGHLARYLETRGDGTRMVEIDMGIATAAVQWLSDPIVNQWLDFGAGRQLATATTILMVGRSPAHFVRAVLDPAGRVAGIGGLQHIDHPAKSAMLWGVRAPLRPPVRSVAVIQTYLFLREAFHRLSMKSVYAWVAEPNQFPIAVLTALGFRLNGRQRAAHWLQGGVVDRLLFDILDHEFFACEEAYRATA